MSPTPQKLRLTYFGIKGRGEVLRLTLHIGGVPFEDDRIDGEGWKTLKSTTPFGQVPLLTINDTTQIAQSHALLRYTGTLSGLYPAADLVKAALVDQVTLHIEDINIALSAIIYEKDADRRAKFCKTFYEEKGPAMLSALERVINQHSGGKWAVGDSLTVADLSIYDITDFLKSGLLKGVPTTITDGHARINEIYNAVHSHPKVVEWDAAHAN
ncbi:hypothetical protein BASA50_000479 [Batrachochytrium salamandrivorans]|uniref:Glutathione S-transferase n=1 Tax=Batrachochytrium salamandrivorans TaxID=1357716 RepID=A0ABQ8ETX6_9FUNG|nr:hypothetical protein BASA62_005676 [Batrachochytrium salamandrivorans]KAH6572690.1 hypothetical protein BASA60_006501 [Batrachochytrium salamandrivorans]KAH6586525.1 hypothetical protein BASA50_000479 [Batrachochytrium salamandrivorans]KAH6596840.1 hypothetical protein BASA61_003334 [Batrachochytrium salamandrivorans]KAH9275407.1 hypothetical protein BASA83_002180 [Batrachochytrium salamandrivorans]